MFNLRLVTKRELLMYADTIDDLKGQVKTLRELIEHERLRAEGAINLLLMKTQRAVLTPQDPLTLEQLEKSEEVKAKMLNIFGDEDFEATTEEEKRQERMMEDLQSGR